MCKQTLMINLQTLPCKCFVMQKILNLKKEVYRLQQKVRKQVVSHAAQLVKNTEICNYYTLGWGLLVSLNFSDYSKLPQIC